MDPEAEPGIEIELHDVQPEQPEAGTDPADREGTKIVVVGSPVARPRVFVHYGCLKQVLGHAYGEVDREVGGVLVGKNFRSRHGLVTELTAAIAARTEKAGLGHITFSHEAWNDIYRQLDELEPQLRIMGWYHSHPGFGIFLSHQDKFIHGSFFAGSQNVALVVDPLSGCVGMFGWRGRRLGSLGGIRILAAEEHQAAAEQLAKKLHYIVSDRQEHVHGLRERLGKTIRRLAQGQQRFEAR